MAKILHLIPTLEGGGAERQLVMLAVELADRGWSVHIGLRRKGVHAATLLHSRVIVHELGDRKYSKFFLPFKINALLRKIDPDVVQTWLPQMDVVGGLGALLRSLPWIISERASKLAFEHLTVTRWLRVWLGRYASLIIANSSEGAGYWRQALANRVPVCIISNAVDAMRIRGTPSAQCSPWREGQKRLLVIGRLDHQKAVEIVLRSFARLRDRKDLGVLIAGDGPLRDELQRELIELGLEETVSIVPYQPDWWGWLKLADVLISMSRYEGQPNVVLESMAAGCPLIVSDIPEHREILSDQSAVFVTPEDCEGLASAISLVLADSASATSRAERAMIRIMDLTVQAAADSYESAYRRLTSGAKS